MTTTSTASLSTLGSRTIISGTASGIDTSALINVAYNQKKREADNIDVKISKNMAKSAAYSELQKLSQAIQTSFNNFKKNYSLLSTSTSVFDARVGTLASSNATPANSLIDVAISPGTSTASYEIEVKRKASVHKVGGNSATTDKTAALAATGTFDIGVAGKTAATINVTAGMSMVDLAAAINATTTTSGVSASILKTSSSGYQLILSGDTYNKNISVSNITGTNVLQNLGVVDGGGAFANIIQNSSDALINLNGTPITRETNDFSDLIDGVSLTVKSAEVGTKIQLKIENDLSTVVKGIENFVTEYNKLRDFVGTNQKLVDGVAAPDAVLFGDFTLKNLVGDIQKLIADNYGSGSATFKNLRSIGITIMPDSKLQIDSVKLDTALQTKFSEVKDLFQTSTTIDNSQFRMMGNTSKLKSLTAAIDITYAGGAITNVSVGGDNTLFTISGGNITGKTGTVYEGMSFAYIGTTNATVNFSMTQGLSDLLSNRIDQDSNIVTGTLQSIKMGIDSQNTQMSSRSARILERADAYRQSLIEKYSRYEAKIAASKNTLLQIQAIVKAMNKN